MINAVLTSLFLFLSLHVGFAQCATSLSLAETHWKDGKFGDAINELLAARLCNDAQIAQTANARILAYSREMEQAKEKLAKTSRELKTANDALEKQKTAADTLARQAQRAAASALQSEQKAAQANRNFYNGLVILFDYISVTGHTGNFTGWAADQRHTDSLREVLVLMIDNSPAIREQGPGAPARWKSILAGMQPEHLAQLFAILGSEASDQHDDASTVDPAVWTEAGAYLNNREPRRALNKLLPLEPSDKSLQLYENIVLCYRRLNMLDSAEYFARKMLQLRPNASRSLLSMRAVKATQKDFRAAEYYARRVLDAKNAENEPLQVNDYANHAYYLLFTGDYAGALQEAEAAYALEPRDWVLVNRAHALLFLYRQDEAFQVYETLKEKSNDAPSGSGVLKKVILADLDEMQAAGLTHPAWPKLREQMTR